MATSFFKLTFTFIRPDLNAIEQWNARIKDSYRKKLLEALMREENVKISPIVTAAVNSVSVDVTKRIAEAGIKRLKDRSKVMKDLVWEIISHREALNYDKGVKFKSQSHLFLIRLVSDDVWSFILHASALFFNLVRLSLLLVLD